MVPKFKPGSRAQRLHEVWSKKGLDAAIAFGPTLGLNANTVTSWVSVWEGKPKEAKPKKAKAASEPSKKNGSDEGKAKLPKRIKGYKFNPTGKRRVRCTYLPGRFGWLIAEGPEVSEIRWDDKEFGHIYVQNDCIKDAPKGK